MTDFISLSQAFAQWKDLARDVPEHDGPALAESWNDYTDELCESGELSPLQYHYAPAYDEDMPGTGSQYDVLSDDREFIIEAMGVTMAATFVPFSQSRNKSSGNPSLNWRVTVKLDGRDVVTDVDYSQGYGHCPADKKTFNSPAYNPSSEKLNAIRYECETGRVYTSRFNDPRRPTGKMIDSPPLTDIMNSLLLDASALDSRDFADWASEFGYSDDSIKARDTYLACMDTATKLRKAFGAQRIEELRELFRDM